MNELKKEYLAKHFSQAYGAINVDKLWQWIEQHGNQQRIDELGKLKQTLNPYQISNDGNDTGRAKADATIGMYIQSRIKELNEKS